MNVEDLLHPLLHSYLNAPNWVKASLGRAYAAIPPSWRRGRQYGRFVLEAGIEGKQALHALSMAKLARTLSHALATVPAYSGLRKLAAQVDQPLALLRNLPLISKEDVKRDPNMFLAAGVPASMRMKMVTGGSTSLPMTFYLHKGVTRAKEYAYMERFHERAGFQGRETVLALRGNASPTALGGRLWTYEPIKRQLMFSNEHLTPAHLPVCMQAMQRWKPRFIQAYPSAAGPLALWLRAHPHEDLSRRIKAVMLFSENVTAAQLALLREVFRCPVLCHYGHSERVLMAATMPDDDRYFFWPHYGFLELVDARGRPVTQPGELGEITGTGFDNEVMPLIRYRTGDMAVLGDRAHPALPGFPVVERIEGRIQEFVVCEHGRLISLNSITTDKQHPLLEYAQALQFEQRHEGRLLMRVVMPRTLTQDELSSIARSVERRIGTGCSVKAQQVAHIARTARGKAVMLEQHLDTRHYFGGAIAA